ncbi:MAG: hypothetical protein KatS3mg082_1446 [Nitrospiraceae bacterium]|nr:MAG: hypothetical protein KatS3mg082_1446 [Nitrospiraceae bacterium]
MWSLNTVVDLRKPVVIVGPSGAGKTTLLMAIAGIIRPTTGTIEIDGVNVEDLDTKDIVLVPKEDFVVEGSIWENLTYGVEGEVSQAVARMHLERLGLWEAIDAKGGLGAPVVGMSSGEIKRLMVVRALLLSSRLLLLDEPTSGLDIQTATYLLETLTSLPFKVIITTHQPLPAVETTIVLSKRT